MMKLYHHQQVLSTFSLKTLYSNSSCKLFRKQRDEIIDETKRKPIAIFTFDSRATLSSCRKRADLALKEMSVHYNTRHRMFI